MKYVKPTYKNEAVEAEDVILTSAVIDLGNGVSLNQIDQNNAQVSTSVNSVLGIR